MTTDEEIIADKTLRRDIDNIIQDAKVLPESPERTQAILKLKEALMWFGMDLKRIRDAGADMADPYPDGKDPSNTNIAPTADGVKL